MAEADEAGEEKEGSGITGAEKVGGAGGGMAAALLRATAAAEAGGAATFGVEEFDEGDEESEKEGTLPFGEGFAAVAFGVVWEEGASTVGGVTVLEAPSSADVVVMVTGDFAPSPPSCS